MFIYNMKLKQIICERKVDYIGRNKKRKYSNMNGRQKKIKMESMKHSVFLVPTQSAAHNIIFNSY